MESLGNLVLQFFAMIILPLILPVFLLAILTGMSRPERLMEEVLGTAAAILFCFAKMFFAGVKAAAKAIGSAAEKSGRRYPPSGGSRRSDSQF